MSPRKRKISEEYLEYIHQLMESVGEDKALVVCNKLPFKIDLYNLQEQPAGRLEVLAQRLQKVRGQLLDDRMKEMENYKSPLIRSMERSLKNIQRELGKHDNVRRKNSRRKN